MGLSRPFNMNLILMAVLPILTAIFCYLAWNLIYCIQKLKRKKKISENDQEDSPNDLSLNNVSGPLFLSAAEVIEIK
jgi:hypothetical protein